MGIRDRCLSFLVRLLIRQIPCAAFIVLILGFGLVWVFNVSQFLFSTSVELLAGKFSTTLSPGFLLFSQIELGRP